MSREKNLVKNTAILSLGTLFPKLIAVILTPILTAKLSKAEFGQYDLVTTIVSLLLPALTLQISSAAFRFLIEKKNDLVEQKSIISTIYAFVIPVSLIATMIYVLIMGGKFNFTTLLICVYFLGDILLSTTQQIIRGLGKNLLYSISCITRSIIDLILVVMLLGVVFPFSLGLNGVLIALSCATIGGLIVLFFGAHIYSLINIKSVNRCQLFDLLKYSWPMVPNNLSTWVLRLSDRLVITAVLGIEANAVYAVANKLPNLFSAVQNTFIYAWQENASIAVNDNDKEEYYSKLCNEIWYILIGIMALLIVFTPILFHILIRGDYDEAFYQMPVLYFGMLFSCMSSVIGGIYIAYKRTVNVGLTTMVAAIVNLIIDLSFVKLIGIWAGSISTMVSYLFLVIFRMIDVQKFQRVRFEYVRIIIGFGLLVLMGFLCYQRTVISYLINVVLCMLVLYIYDKKVIKTLLATLINRYAR